MNTLLNFIVNPVKVFNTLKKEEKFPVATFIILLTLALINMILNVPVTSKIRGKQANIHRTGRNRFIPVSFLYKSFPAMVCNITGYRV